MKVTTRRNFFKQVFFYTSAGALTHLLVNSEAFAAEPMLIDMTGLKRKDAANKGCVTTAKSIGYVEDLAAAIKDPAAAKKASPSYMPHTDKAGHKAATQTCDTCMFYNYKKATPAQPTCMLIPACLVHAKGTCNSWAAKT
ncbi:MAG: high-potential iron-sulfur protein [Bdellovibrionales bacterium]|nr:high-potential iron-sulfur protein [Bdellovibrionales bacterium]